MITFACCSLQRIESMIWPILTRATVPYGLPQAPRIPVWSLPGRQPPLMLGISGTKYAPIGSSTRQHLVDTDDVVGVNPDPQVERIFSGRLGDIFVCANTGSFKGLTRELLILVRHQMAAEGEFIDRCTFASQIENTNLPSVNPINATARRTPRTKLRTLESGTPRLYRDLG